MTSGASNSDQQSLVEALLEGMGEGFFAIDRDWRFTAFNSAAEAIFGVPRADIVGRLLWDASPHTKGTEFDRRCRRCHAGAHKGGIRELFGVAPRSLSRGAGFSFWRWRWGGVSRHHRSPERHAQALRGRELELARVQRIGGVGGLEVDLSHGFRSPALSRISPPSWASPRVVNDTHEQWVARVHPDDRERVEKYFLASVAGSGKDYKAEYRIIRPQRR